jgi:hypothetical protein
VATFTVATGTAPPYPPSVHLTFGNPNGATADINQPNNYLMEKPEFTLSYNRDKGGPNWVSWHLSMNGWELLLALIPSDPILRSCRRGIACKPLTSPTAVSIAVT